MLNVGRNENLQIQIDYKIKPVGDANTIKWWLWHRGIYEFEVKKIRCYRDADSMLKWYAELTNIIHDELGCFGYCKIPEGVRGEEIQIPNERGGLDIYFEGEKEGETERVGNLRRREKRKNDK